MDGFSYMSLDDWLRWIRDNEAVDQSQEDPEEWSVNQPYTLDRLIAASSRINDSLAAGGWSTPLTQPYPPSIVQACAWIAWFNCETWGEIRQSVERHYEETIKWLDSLAKGTAVLTGGDGKPIPQVGIVENTAVRPMYSGSRIAANPWRRVYYPGWGISPIYRNYRM